MARALRIARCAGLRFGDPRVMALLASLTRNCFIERIPAAHTYRVTPEGRRIACF